VHDGTSEPILDTSQGLISAVGGQDLNALEFVGAEVHVGVNGANNAMVVDEGWSGAGPITSWVSHPSAIGYRLQGVVSAGSGSGSGGGGGGSGSGSGGGGTITIAAVSPDFDSGMNDGTDGQELERVANFYTGTEENPTSAQSAPTPRAEQDLSNDMPPRNPAIVPTPFTGQGGGPDSPAVVATPYSPQSDDGGQVVPAGEPPAGANQSNGQKSWYDWFWDLVQSPGDDPNLVEGAPKAKSDITPQLENDLNSGLPATPGMLRNDGGKNFGQRMGDVNQAMLSDFPLYAIGVIVEVGIDALAPEEIVALKGMALAKGLVAKQFAKKGGGQVLRFVGKKGQDLLAQVKGLLDDFVKSRKAPNRSTVVPQSGYRIAPTETPGIPGLKVGKRKTPVQGGGGLRKRWTDVDGNIYEWDSRHGALEKYNSNGGHLGEFDPATGNQTKPADASRNIKKYL
jgi:hypothetical protein